jgi:hypothetical protein
MGGQKELTSPVLWGLLARYRALFAMMSRNVLDHSPGNGISTWPCERNSIDSAVVLLYNMVRKTVDLAKTFDLT